MGKSLGIASFVFLLLSFPIPILGNYITFIALLLACGSGACGETTWTVTVDIISWIKLFFLSPSWHIAMFGAAYMQGMQNAVMSLGQRDAVAERAMTNGVASASSANHITLYTTLAFLIAPIAFLVWRTYAAKAATDPPRAASRGSNSVLFSDRQDNVAGRFRSVEDPSKPLPNRSIDPVRPTPTSTPENPQGAQSGANDDQDTAFWDSVGDKNDVDHLEEYLTRFPQGRFAQLAQSRLERKGIVAPVPFEMAANPLPVATEAHMPIQPAQTWCAGCGVALEPDSKFCADCGESVPA
jgi:hypothetical protein